jgi:hypothetical protein
MVSSYLLIPFFGVVAAASSTNAILLLLVLAGWRLTYAPASKQWAVQA